RPLVSRVVRPGCGRRRARTALPRQHRRRAVRGRSVRAVPTRFTTPDPRRRSGGLIVFGYHGRYLRIDVTTGRAEFVRLAEEVLRRFVGGVGLGTWLLHREGPTGVDPLASSAPLIFAFSPLVGTPLTTSAKFAVV